MDREESLGAIFLIDAGHAKNFAISSMEYQEQRIQEKHVTKNPLS
jgi:hypothetical protein